MPRLAVDRRWDRLGPLMGRAIAVAGTLMAGCTFGRGPEPVRDQMLAHFELAAELRQSALMGDLRGVRRAADRLVDLERPPDLAADRGDDVLPLARAARDAGRARTADEAARATARVARACADCHLASRVGLGNRLGVPYTEGAAARRHTPALARAAGLLWTGVAGPSDRLWRAGAEALRGVAPLPTEIARWVPSEYARNAEGRLLTLLEQASTAEAREDRELLLAEIWATCAGCHGLAADR